VTRHYTSHVTFVPQSPDVMKPSHPYLMCPTDFVMSCVPRIIMSLLFHVSRSRGLVIAKELGMQNFKYTGKYR
jgi:hypothetical protein